MRCVLACAVAAVIGLSAVPGIAQDKLSIWWVKGFYRSEDEALYAAIRRYEQKTGTKVDLSQYAAKDMNAKSVAALDAGTVPDIAYSDTYDVQTAGKWAFDGKLEDISDIMAPAKDKFLKGAAETTYLYNDKTKKKAYYAFPLKQQTMHIQYWKNMLADAGYKDSDIPTSWKAYWDFWCDKVQPAHRTKTGKRTYAIGQPMGVDSSDSFYSFLTFVDAYNVKLVTDDGKLTVDDPKVKAALVAALKDYTSIRTRGCTPPSSTSWKDPDNNVSFHNNTILMTHNATISIAAKWLDDANNASLTPEQRATARKNYDENIATAGFPKKPDGSPMIYRAAVKTGVIFEGAKNKKRAKEFVSFLLQDENLQPYVEGSLGRWYPVTKSGTTSAFWQADPHRKAVQAQFNAGTTPFEFTKNYKFTVLNNENVWAKAMSRVVNDGWTPEKATDEMIARIKQVAG